MLPHRSCSPHSAAPAPLAPPLLLAWLLSWRLLHRARPRPGFLSQVPPAPPAPCTLASLFHASPPAPTLASLSSTATRRSWLLAVPMENNTETKALGHLELEEADGDGDMVAEAFDHQARAEIENTASHTTIVDAVFVLSEDIEDLVEERRRLVRVAVWLVLVRAVAVADGRVHLVPGVGLAIVATQAIVRAASRGAVVVGGMSYVRITILMLYWLFGY